MYFPQEAIQNPAVGQPIPLNPPNPAYSYYPQPQIDYNIFNPPHLTPGVVDQDNVDEVPSHKIEINKIYLNSPLFYVRIILIVSLIATVIASALVVNRDWAVRQESSYDVSVWLSVLIFSNVELALSLLILLLYSLNIPNLPGCNPKIINILVS
jgi:hypothetical protein